MQDKISQIEKGKMKRVLGVFDLFSVGYGDLGSSIYYALGITALYALGATPLALLMAGIVFVCTALTYAEMSSIMFEAGGSASFARKSFNDLISFIAGWGLLLDYIVTIAISAYAVAPYLMILIPFLGELWPKIIFTIFIIMVLLVINIKGSKQSTIVSIVLTGLALLTQVVIIVIGGITLLNMPEFISHLKIGGLNKLWSPTWREFMHGVAMAMVAYTGIESMAQLSAEAKNPSKTVPRAIILAMVTLLIIYIGISVVALSALNPQTLSTTYLENPISGIASVLPIGKTILAPWISVLAAVILIVAANAGLMGASRLSFNMGEYFQLPLSFYKLHSKHKTPYVSLIVFAVLSSLIVLWSFGRLSFLADLYNFGAMLAFFCAHISLIMHRIRFPDIERPFRIPFNLRISLYKIPITSIIGAIATAFVWILIVIDKPDGRWLGLAWLVVGLSMYIYQRKKYKISPTGHVEIEKIKIEDFKEVKVKKILLPTRGLLATETVVIGCDIAKMFNADLYVVHIVEVPYMLPINTLTLQKETYSEAVVNRARAIGIEKKININIQVIKSRSVVKTVLELVDSGNFDLLIIGSKSENAIGNVVEKILQKAKCRVWIISNESGDSSVDAENKSQSYHEKLEDSGQDF